MEKGSIENPYTSEEFASLYKSGNWVFGFVDFGDKGVYFVVVSNDYSSYYGTGTSSGTGSKLAIYNDGTNKHFEHCNCTSPCTCLDMDDNKRCPSCCGTGSTPWDSGDDDNVGGDSGDNGSYNGEGTVEHGAGSPSRVLYHGNCNISGSVSVGGIPFIATGQLTCSAIKIYRNCYAFEDIYYDISFSSEPIVENLEAGRVLTKSCLNFNMSGALKTSGRPIDTSSIRVNFEIQEVTTVSGNITCDITDNESRNMSFPEILSITGANDSTRIIVMDDVEVSFE